MDEEKKESTSTSAFGTPGRFSHDSSRFYNSRMYQDLLKGKEIDYHENPLPAPVRNAILCQSSEDMSDLPDHSIHLMVTSPPYNARKEYDQDLSLDEYLDMLDQVWQETYRVLVPGGRVCINIANLGRKPYIPLHTFIIEQMLDIGYLMRGEIIWDKAASASPSTAWGSWMSASNPVLRDVHEYILVFSKEGFRRPKGERENTIEKEDFLAWTKSVWPFQAVQARRSATRHPFLLNCPIAVSNSTPTRAMSYWILLRAAEQPAWQPNRMVAILWDMRSTRITVTLQKIVWMHWVKNNPRTKTIHH